jgi:drug/metabolite transporter (DMT)-like permease
MTAQDWAMLLSLSVLWGGAFFFSAVALRELPTLTVVTLRVGLGAIILHGVVRALGNRMPREWRVWRAFLVMGLLNNVIPFILIVWALNHIASGLAAILNATTPLFTVIVAHYLTKDEKITAQRSLGLMAGFLGTLVLIGTDAVHGTSFDALAQLACVGAALSYAFAGVYGRQFKARGIKPVLTATGQLTASSLLLLPIALLADRPWLLPFPGPTVSMAILAAAALSTALGYLLYFRILGSAGATNVLLVTFLIPVSAVLLGTIFLHEPIRPHHLAGMALIALGLALVDGRIAVRRASATG